MESYPVKVYIYDISKGLARAMSGPILGRQLDGIWHTAVVVHGKEFFYGDTGVGYCEAGERGQPDRIEDGGHTQIPPGTVMDYVTGLASSNYKGERYHLFENNCNTFSDDVAQFLTGKSLPSYITSLPQEVRDTPLGGILAPFIDPKFLTPSGGTPISEFDHRDETATSTEASRPSEPNRTEPASASRPTETKRTGPASALRPSETKHTGTASASRPSETKHTGAASASRPSKPKHTGTTSASRSSEPKHTEPSSAELTADQNLPDGVISAPDLNMLNGTLVTYDHTEQVECELNAVRDRLSDLLGSDQVHIIEEMFEFVKATNPDSGISQTHVNLIERILKDSASNTGQQSEAAGLLQQLRMNIDMISMMATDPTRTRSCILQVCQQQEASVQERLAMGRAAAGLLQQLLTHSDIISMLSHDPTATYSCILQLYQQQDALVQERLAMGVVNCISHDVGRDWLLGGDSSRPDSKVSPLCEEVCSICKYCLLSCDPKLQRVGAALTHNITASKVSEELAVDLGSAVVELLQKRVDDETARHAITALCQCIRYNDEVAAIAAVSGLTVAAIEEQHPELTDVCRQNLERSLSK